MDAQEVLGDEHAEPKRGGHGTYRGGGAERSPRGVSPAQSPVRQSSPRKAKPRSMDLFNQVYPYAASSVSMDSVDMKWLWVFIRSDDIEVYFAR